MWEISNNTQFFSFWIAALFGVIYCLFYDILRSLRKTVVFSAVAVFFQDIVYFIIIAVVTFMLMLSFTDGEIRAYILVGVLLGFVVCNFTVSLFFRKFLKFLFSLILKGFNGFCKVFARSLEFIFNKLGQFGSFLLKNFKKMLKFLKKILKHRRKIVYTKTNM